MTLHCSIEKSKKKVSSIARQAKYFEYVRNVVKEKVSMLILFI